MTIKNVQAVGIRRMNVNQQTGRTAAVVLVGVQQFISKDAEKFQAVYTDLY